MLGEAKIERQGENYRIGVSYRYSKLTLESLRDLGEISVVYHDYKYPSNKLH